MGLSFGIEPSLRIKALGLDFAFLIPDYETDLYLDPNIYSKENRLAGISYEHDNTNPITVRFLTSRFGWIGQYWGNYDYSNDNIRRIIETLSFSARDLWIWDARKLLPSFLGDIWNLSNDLSLNKFNYNSYPYYDSIGSIKYILGIPGSNRIGKWFKLYMNLAVGYYRNYSIQYHQPRLDQSLLIYSGKAGIGYRYLRQDNDFISGYIEIAGPTTTAEIDALPIPITYMLNDNDFDLTYFLNTIITRIALVKAFPLNERSFVAIGFHDQFLSQGLAEADTNITRSDANNTLKMPIALEYKVGQVAIRLGSVVRYSLRFGKIRQNDTILRYDINQNLSWSKSFGIGWQPNLRFSIDLINNGDLSSVLGWGIYLKYCY
jgi:hypothetical protein